MYAIIETGGKQYRVSPGDVVFLEKLTGDVGQTLTFDKVLLVGGEGNSQVLVGTPYVAKALTQVEIVAHDKGEKLLTIKYKRRKGYRRMIGHRQNITKVLVTKIDNGQGQATQFDAAKRGEALRKASISAGPAKRKETRAATGTAKAETKAAPAKKAATTKKAKKA